MDAVKNLLLAGPEGKYTAFSDETLSKLRLDLSRDFTRWADPISWYIQLFLKCLHLRNPYARYVQSLNLAFHDSKLQLALEILGEIKDV